MIRQHSNSLRRSDATELVARTPGFILAATTAAVLALKRTTQIVPIVFVGVIDPVGSGLVASLAQPGGNITGFLSLGTTCRLRVSRVKL